MMAVWSRVKFMDIFDGLDFAAEHYHPAKLVNLSRLINQGGLYVNDLVKPVRDTCAPSHEVPVFDLSAAHKHVLQVEDAYPDERVSIKKVALGGDVIVSRLRSYLKQVAYIPETIQVANLSTEFIVLRSRNRSSIAFLVPFILSEPIQTILAWSQDGNEHPRFNEKVLLHITIPPQVQSISKKLNACVLKATTSLDKALQAYSEAGQLLFRELGFVELDLSPTLFYRRSYSETCATARLDAEFYLPKYQRVLKALKRTRPEHIAPLGEYISFLTNGHTPLHHDLVEGAVPFLTAENVFDFRIEYDTEKRILTKHHKGELKRTQLRQGDCLITIKGRIGNAAIAEDIPGQTNINQDVALFRLREGLPPYYLLAYLNSSVGKAFSNQYCTGQINPFLGLGNLRLLPIAIYSPKRMESIAAKTREVVMFARSAHDESRRLLEEAKQMVEEALLGNVK